MEFEPLVTETLEQLASDLSPELMVRQDDEPVWGIDLANGDWITLSLLAEQQRLVCSIELPSTWALEDGNVEFHQWLLMESQDSSVDGGISVGLNDDGMVLLYDLPLKGLGRERLLRVIRSLRSTAAYMREELPATDEPPPEPPSAGDELLRV